MIKRWKFAHRLFQYITIVPRPLLVEELAELVTVASDVKVEAIPAFLSSLISVQRDRVKLCCSRGPSLVSVVHTLYLVIQFSANFCEGITRYPSRRLASPKRRKAFSHFYVSVVADAHTIIV